MTNDRLNELRNLEQRLEALERRRAAVPPTEPRQFEEFVEELKDKIEILRDAIGRNPRLN